MAAVKVHVGGAAVRLALPPGDAGGALAWLSKALAASLGSQAKGRLQFRDEEGVRFPSRCLRTVDLSRRTCAR